VTCTLREERANIVSNKRCSPRFVVEPLLMAGAVEDALVLLERQLRGESMNRMRDVECRKTSYMSDRLKRRSPWISSATCSR
jgi:hypothetical protein